MELDPSALPARDLYQWMIGTIVPRPIAWITTQSPAGAVNLAPFSFFNGVCSRPPVISVGIGYRRGEKKDTLRNIEDTGEFVVNLVPEDLAEAMNMTSGDYAPEVNEAEVAKVSLLPSIRVKPPRVEGAPVAFECRLHRLVPVGEAPEGSTLVLGEIVYAHAADAVLKDGRVDPTALQLVGRMGGTWYCRTRDVFSMPRPEV